jgi:hypothetical protein
VIELSHLTLITLLPKDKELHTPTVLFIVA